MPNLRTRTAGAKVTEDEYAEIEKRADARGVTVGEWCREVILAEVERKGPRCLARRPSWRKPWRYAWRC